MSDGVLRLDAGEQASGKRRERELRGKPDAGIWKHQKQAVGDGKLQHGAAPGAECDADADLGSALARGVGQDSLDPDGRQKPAQQAERSGKHRPDPNKEETFCASPVARQPSRESVPAGRLC